MNGQGWLFALVLAGCLPLGLVGCGKGPPAWSSFPVAISADPAIASSPTAKSDFADALAFWEGKAGRKLFDYQGAWGGQMPPYTGNATTPDAILGNVIFFQNPWPVASNLVGLTVVNNSDGDITSSMIMINPGAQYCSGDCTGQSGLTSMRKAFTHEVGHFLGLQHVQDTANIMFPVIQPGGSLDGVTVDKDTLNQLTQQ